MAGYTNKEMQAVTIAKQIKDGQVVIVGTGLPLIGASLAKRVYAPNCNLIVESGLMDCDPIEVPRSVGDCRFMAHCATQWPNIRFIGFEANEWLHDNERLVAFIGGAQIDPYGNVNSTCIGDYHNPKTRFTGSGGANGIATYAMAEAAVSASTSAGLKSWVVAWCTPLSSATAATTPINSAVLPLAWDRSESPY